MLHTVLEIQLRIVLGLSISRRFAKRASWFVAPVTWYASVHRASVHWILILEGATKLLFIKLILPISHLLHSLHGLAFGSLEVDSFAAVWYGNSTCKCVLDHGCDHVVVSLFTLLLLLTAVISIILTPVFIIVARLPLFLINNLKFIIVIWVLLFNFVLRVQVLFECIWSAAFILIGSVVFCMRSWRFRRPLRQRWLTLRSMRVVVQRPYLSYEWLATLIMNYRRNSWDVVDVVWQWWIEPDLRRLVALARTSTINLVMLHIQRWHFLLLFVYLLFILRCFQVPTTLHSLILAVVLVATAIITGILLLLC